MNSSFLPSAIRPWQGLTWLLATLGMCTTLAGQSPCEGGLAAGLYPCNHIDLLSTLGVGAVGGGDMNDIWGWTDPLDGTEYVILCRTSGTAFIDISDPINPLYLGNLPTNTVNSLWRDAKVFSRPELDQHHAFIVSEAGGHGMQVFDLTKLRDVSNPPQTFAADAVYTGFGNAHNIVINEATGHAYGVGTGTANGGLHIVDINDPLNPTIVGLVSEEGYTHDAHVVNYAGPDPDHQGKEIAFACNEVKVSIIDVTDPTDAIVLSNTLSEGNYNAGYTHQGWLTEDHRFFVLGDELDEYYGTVNGTTTYFWNVEDLDNPFLAFTYTSSLPAIDHNLYIKDGIAYQSNYRAGLRMMDVSDLANGNASEIAYFDVYPSSNSAAFNGSWSNYPFFASGVVAVSHIEQGLFLLRPSIFTASTPAELVCFNESVEVTLTSQSTAGNLSVLGLPAGVSVDIQPTSTGAVVVLSEFPQGPFTTYDVTLTDNQGNSAEVSFSVFDCINEPPGCTDPSALNFDPNAVTFDDSCLYPCVAVTVTIVTDNYPGETTWTVTDEAGNVVMSGGPYAGVGSEFVSEACLDVGCYNLQVFDSFGDGLCCQYGQGSYTLTSASGVNITGGAFSSSVTEAFCLELGALGCTDMDACNYDPIAETNDGSCTYPYDVVYVDGDGDGVGGDQMIADACDPLPEGWVLVGGDCDDGNAAAYPGAPGSGQGIDNNCDGQIAGDELTDCPADVTQDGFISVADVLEVLGEFGCEQSCTADVDGDLAVTVWDILEILAVFGEDC